MSGFLHSHGMISVYSVAFRFFRESLKISSEILIFSGIDYIWEVPNNRYIKKSNFPKKFSNFLEKNEMLVYTQIAHRGYAKNHITFYSLKKKYNSIEVLHGFEHVFRMEFTDPYRGQTRISADVSIPTQWSRHHAYECGYFKILWCA